MFNTIQQSDITYRIARTEEIPQMAHMAAVSFGDYPLFGLAFRDVFDDHHEYLRYMEHLHRVHIMAYMRRHHCLVGVTNDGRVISVAIMEEPKVRPVGILDYVLAYGISLFHPVGASRLLGFMRLNDAPHADCTSRYPDAWYIEMLAVDDDHKGQGLGGRMIHDCLIPLARFHNAERLTLNTNTESNRKFYMHNGFTQFAERTLVYSGATLGNWSYRMDLR